MNQLIFIYSAKSGVISNIPGAIVKAFGGMSGCALCNITHGSIKEKPAWVSFVASLSAPPIIYHTNEIPADIKEFLDKNALTLPVVLEQRGTTWGVVVTSDELNDCKGSVGELVRLLREFGRRAA